MEGLVELHLGDCLEVMGGMASCSIDAVVTDPPYGLEFMGRDWDHGVPGVRFWAELLRVSKPGAHLVAFGGTRTHHRLMCAVEDAGWEVRDCLMWVYGSGFPKSHNLKKEWSGWGTALKPAWEPVVLARKVLEGTVAENVLKWGTGALNIDGCRIEIVPGVDDSQIRTMSRSRRTEDTSGQVWGMNKGLGDKPQVVRPSGRWPANVIHDGSDEVLELFPTVKSGIMRAGQQRKATVGKGGYHGNFPDEATKDGTYGDSGSAARFFYCAKASKQERDDGCEELEERKAPKFDGGDFVNLEWDSNSKQTLRRNHHPTVKPLALMRYLCRLVTPPGGIVLDPFMGSGSTGKAALAEGFRFIGVEKEPEYLKIARARIGAV